ncbi:MAG: hypothetical protein IK127_04045 [Clostridia bacterium]|nr:hypothetical protein [Clostridia bacterium]
MFARGRADHPSAFLTPLGSRPERYVYFLRVASWSRDLDAVLWKCHEAARHCGVILENGVPNPENSNLTYYREILGDHYALDTAGASADLAKWMPELPPQQREALAAGISSLLQDEKRQGKTEGALKNLYIKLMCWLYYRFRSVARQLGREPLPLILCQTKEEPLSAHALLLLRLLSGIGADVLLLELAGDEAYLSRDPDNQWSDLCRFPDAKPFPVDYSLKTLRKQFGQTPVQPQAPVPPQTPKPTQKPITTPAPAPKATPTPPQPSTPLMAGGHALHIQSRPHVVEPAAREEKPAAPSRPRRHPEENEILLHFQTPQKTICANAWMPEANLRGVLIPPARRSENATAWCTALIRMKGLRDKITYARDLYSLYQELRTSGRRVTVADETPGMPSPEDLNRIRRRSQYRNATELIVDLASNLPPTGTPELRRLAERAFAVAMMEEDLRLNNLGQLRTSGVWLLAWIQTMLPKLFSGWRGQDMPVYILMGHCRTPQEALFLRWLSLMPADVLIFAPNLNQPCCFTAPELLELSGDESLAEFAFPRDSASLTMRTVASRASEEIGAVLGESGLYRSHQFGLADALVLNTTVDEVFQYWNESLNLRPNFSANGGAVTMPILWTRISGVEERDENAYWRKVATLIGAPDILLVRSFPAINPMDARQQTGLAQKYLMNGRIQAEGLTTDRAYPYRLLQQKIQTHMLDKAQQMLDQRLIKGTGVNGTEYTLLSTVLSLPKPIPELLQSFDFTKRNPKVVCVHSGKSAPVLEDAILLTFLSLVGFDVVIFAPTGYQSIEPFLNDRLPIEHQAGAYHFDYTVPDFSAISQSKSGLFSKLFGRRN